MQENECGKDKLSKVSQSDVILRSHGVHIHPLTAGVCEGSNMPVLDSANHQYHFMFVVPFAEVLPQGGVLDFPNPVPTLFLPLDLTFALGVVQNIILGE